MGSSADGNALCNWVGDMKHPADHGREHIAHQSGDDNHGDGQGDIAAQLLRNAHADGGGDGLGQQGHILCMIQPEDQSHGQYAQKRGQHPGGDAQKNGGLVLLQQIQLFIEGNGQTDGGWGQKIAQILCAGIVHVVIHIGHGQQRNGDDNGDQQGVKQRAFPLLLQQAAQTVGHQTDGHPEKCGGFQKRTHALPPFLRMTS